MKNSISKKVISVIIMAVMCITLFSFGASAVSLNSKGSINLTLLDKETKEPISGAVFRVYLIASVYESNDNLFCVYTDEFKDNGMELENFTDSYLPVHLRAYAESQNLTYTEKSTDNKGEVVFGNLPCGVYLVVPVGLADGYLNPAPFVVSVPTEHETKGDWIYDIDASPKVEAEDDSHEKTYISVKKQWRSTEKTPDSITVSLVKDGMIYDSAVLSAVNNWYYKWENLDKNHSWSVVETNVPDGYTVSYVTSQMTVIITNTDEDYEDETTTRPDETTTTDDSTTTTDGTTNPDDTTTTVGTTTPDDVTTTGTTDTANTTKPVGTTKPTGTTESTTKPEELIKTGQLNWPVPIFTIAGLLLFSTGWAMLNLGKKEEEIV